MKRKWFFTAVPVLDILILFSIISALLSYFYLPLNLFFIELLFCLVCVGVAVVCFWRLRHSIYRYLTQAAKSVENAGSDSLNNFVLPVVTVNSYGEVVWYNESFRRNVLRSGEIYAENQSFLFSKDALRTLDEKGQVSITYRGKRFNVYAYQFSQSVDQKMYFFIDNTFYFELTKKYKETRPCVMFIRVDGLDFILKNAPESRKTEIIGAIERQIETSNDNVGGYFQKISNDEYVMILQKNDYDRILNDKFPVLSKVRELNVGDRTGVTLSIGVGVGGDTLGECVEFARQAIDMALGRGGDQAVIKNKDDFEFFGGVAQTEQSNSKVRARVVAATLAKLIANSDNVLIMGHSYSDMDSFGSAYALYHAVNKMNKPVKIVVNREKSLARSLIDYVTKSDKTDAYLVEPEEAEQLIDRKTLLIITDTHRASFTENKRIYELAPTVVVIDHHRKTVDYIDNALLFYHVPFASSACEMVTELLQYMGNDLVGKVQAEALLAGIMLDTRNFVLRTAQRTFEASAYLRGQGANPVEVKQLFDDSMLTYKIRAEIVSNAHLVNGCAIASCENTGEYARIASSQAADELLSIEGVNASFVMYHTNDGINISARSYGKVNVQIIMEQLGGGGHQTMAAAQLKCHQFDEAKKELIEAISKIKSLQSRQV